MIGIYNSSNAAQTTICEEASISLSEMEQVGKKWKLQLVVESQKNHSKTTNMPAPYRMPAQLKETPAANHEIELSIPQMNTESQMRNAVDVNVAPMKRVRRTK